jgi:hypothetical protein
MTTLQIPTNDDLTSLALSDSNISTVGFTTDKRRYYTDSWNFFVSITLLQRDIQEIRKTDPRIGYYRYISYQERAMFNLGQRLHIEAYPEYQWCEEYE